MPQININSDLLVAQPLPGNKVSWTLASRLGDMLDMAEKLFGGRDTSYTLLGTQFTSDGPRIWYRGKHRKHIIIQLSLRAAANMSQACYEMAQETIHLLAPSVGRSANNFEEGVSCYFAAYYMKEKFNEPSWSPNHSSYERALVLIKPRLDEDIDCVRRIRKNQPSFWDMTKEDISEEFPNLESKDVDFLISEFDRGSGS